MVILSVDAISLNYVTFAVIIGMPPALHTFEISGFPCASPGFAPRTYQPRIAEGPAMT